MPKLEEFLNVFLALSCSDLPRFKTGVFINKINLNVCFLSQSKYEKFMSKVYLDSSKRICTVPVCFEASQVALSSQVLQQSMRCQICHMI